MLITTQNHYPIIDGEPENCIPILPWGSIEPHGEQLPYITDSILAECVATDSATKTTKRCVMIPTVSMGSQNPGQWDKLMCLHFSQETQKSVLKDIVTSLEIQGFKRLVIVNGHNGNSFKGIVRDLEFEYPKFKIYVCNYLDIVDKMKPSETIPFPDVDDHAGFTETSLMMHYHPDMVDTSSKAEGVKENTGYSYSTLWTPRNWGWFAINTRIGDASKARPWYGREIAEFVTDEIAKDLDRL